MKEGTITKDLAYTPGALGCALSHVALWKKAVSQNKSITIFEDDIICSIILWRSRHGSRRAYHQIGI